MDAASADRLEDYVMLDVEDVEEAMFMADALNLIDNVETAGVVALSMQNARRAQAETAAALEEVKQLKATLAKRLRAEQELRICLADAKARVEAYELKLEKCRQLKANKQKNEVGKEVTHHD